MLLPVDWMLAERAYPAPIHAVQIASARVN